MSRHSYLFLVNIVVLLMFQCSQSYQLLNTRRRIWIQHVSIFTVGLLSLPTRCYASDELIDSISEAQKTLGLLLANWQRATVECNYADVPRELLSADNKQLLLEKASTYALFDKSVSVESCKTSNRLVRDYIGVTGKGPLVGIEKKIRKALELVEPNSLDEYVSGTVQSMLMHIPKRVLLTI
jgi:hypothetical protein